jgi:hypothetical protein
MVLTRGVFLLVAALCPLAAHAELPKATLHLVRGAGNPLEIRVAGEALEAALALRRELGFVSRQELLEPRAALDVVLANADTEVAKGRTAIENLEIAEGVSALARAIAQRERAWVALAENPEAVDTHAQLLAELAVAQFLAGDQKKAEATLGGAFVLAPKLEFDKKKHPPQMKRLFDSTRFLLDEVGAGELAIATTPQGAAVRVNGTLVGYSPVQAKQIGAGRNLVTVSLPGYATRTLPVDCAGGGKVTRVRIQLSELEGGIAAALAGAAREAGGGRSSSASAVARRLGVRWLFVGSASARDEKVSVVLHAYDASGQASGQVRGTLEVPTLERDAQALAGSLVALLTRPAAPVAKAPSGPSFVTRVYRSPYFWPVVGGVLAAAAVGAGLGVYFGTRGEGTGDRDRRFLILY